MLEKSFGRGRTLRPWPELRRQVKAYLAGERASLSIPLDVRAPGEFTALVWKVAASVPYGRTATYGDVARRAGRPGAARAVGQALKRNPVPLFIPCHRIVASGGPGGFEGRRDPGLKVRLMALESVKTGMARREKK